MSVAGITAAPCTISRGEVELLQHPTGSTENLKVVVITGHETDNAPTLLITVNIHGDEVNGIIVVHRLIEQLQSRLSELRGRVVIFPSLNPTGLINATRGPMFEDCDPNRKWPEWKPETKPNKHSASDWLADFYKASEKKSEIQEKAFAKIFDIFREIKPTYHLDLHTFSCQSLPFIFLDRVLYDSNQSEGPYSQSESEALFERTKAMVQSLGLTVLMERPGDIYTKRELHRSTSGATLNTLRIPSCTIELGSMNTAQPHCRDAGLQAIYNVMTWSAMLPGEHRAIEEATTARVAHTPELYRFVSYPHCPVTGIVDYIAQPGDFFEKGTLLAVVRSITGEPLAEIRSEWEERGFLLAWADGVAKYEGQVIGYVGLPDRLACVVDWQSLV